MLSAYYGLICITHNTTSEAPLELFAKFLLFPNCQLFQVLGWFFLLLFLGCLVFFVFPELLASKASAPQADFASWGLIYI